MGFSFVSSSSSERGVGHSQGNAGKSYNKILLAKRRDVIANQIKDIHKDQQLPFFLIQRSPMQN